MTRDGGRGWAWQWRVRAQLRGTFGPTAPINLDSLGRPCRPLLPLSRPDRPGRDLRSTTTRPPGDHA